MIKQKEIWKRIGTVYTNKMSVIQDNFKVTWKAISGECCVCSKNTTAGYHDPLKDNYLAYCCSEKCYETNFNRK